MFFYPLNSLLAIGWEVGIYGYELFLKENLNQKYKQSEVPGWDFHFQKWGKVFTSEPYLNRISGESMFVGLKDKNNKNQILWDLDIKLTTGPDTGLRNYYLGKNHYFGYITNQFFLGVGRREHLFSPKSFSTHYDGGDGLFLELKPLELLTFQFFLWDFYSGSILLSKDQFRSLLQLPNEKDQYQTNNVTSFRRNHHRRQSFGFVYGKSLVLRSGFHYLEFGSLGPYNKDHPHETKKNEADGDSLFSGNFGFGFHTEQFSFDIDFLWCKGNDRTRSQNASQPGSIPIAGEAIQVGGEFRFGRFKFRNSHMLSDRAEKNEKQQIVKEGFISLGSHPSQTPYISQIFRLFPSAAVTENGYEKNFAIIEGRSFGYLSELVLVFQYEQFFIKWIGNYFVPYKQIGPSDGRISFQNREFERFFIGEGMVEISVNDGFGFELGVGMSKLFLPESFGIHSNFGYVYGRLQI
ncbi:LA_2168 family protein [Leptospira bouyouniensis]|uniref:Alginate export domain-containing protein n=1 Tax=Leptospira bouyouniensis TaxID=2484911 RepID=A0ABY2L425_9LEPT|nr:hypothetical protein [Leptospira bouyouniensis]TGK48648.1 hypothetical protein EHQ10_13165 [Leptospira bouyouniensis]